MRNLVFSMILTGAASFSLVIMMPLGCGSPGQLGNQDNVGGAAGIPTIKLDGGLAGGGNAGSVGPPPTGDANCGVQTNSTSKQPADVLLVLDRSGSMGDDIAQDCSCVNTGSSSQACPNRSTCKDRWSTVSSAVTTTVTSTPDIHWGLKLFSTPGGSACDVSNQVEVPVGANSASAIQQRIQSTSPANNTPTAAAVKAATAYLKTVNDPSNKVILLATDGQPNCAPGGKDNSTPDVDGTVAAIAAAKAAGFLVYVIGIGPSVGNLNNFAAAGGTGQYYPATSPQDLANALAAISTRVASCSFTLATTPPDPGNVAVYLDKVLLPQDPSNGWSFGGNSQVIMLNGDACEQIKSGQATTVQVLFGCPGVAPPQNIP